MIQNNKENSVRLLLLAIVGLAVATWGIRLMNEALFEHPSTFSTLWLVVVRPLMMALLGVALARVYLSAYTNQTHRTYWSWCFAAAGIFCIPYVPDMHASFVLAGSKYAIGLSAAFYLLGILTYGVIRGGTCFFGFAITSKILRLSSNKLQSVIVYFLMLCAEYLFFHTWHPITYFPALPLPLPAATFHTANSASKVQYILLETSMDAEARSQIENGGQLALAILGEKIATQLNSKITGMNFSDSVTVILPETIVAVEEPSDVIPLIQPVSEILLKHSSVKHVVWIQGAFVSQTNVVLGSEISKEPSLGEAGQRTPPEVTVLQRKQEHMPMFEAPSKGISYSKQEPRKAVEVQNIPPGQTHLKRFYDSHKIMICYESLFPRNWRQGQASLVLTNHHLFNEYKLMNWVYVGLIRQLSFIFASHTKIVSNFNPSGVMNPILWNKPKEQLQDNDWIVISYK
jgi:hypothetical protein